MPLNKETKPNLTLSIAFGYSRGICILMIRFLCICICPTPPPWAGCDTKLLFLSWFEMSFPFLRLVTYPRLKNSVWPTISPKLGRTNTCFFALELAQKETLRTLFKTLTWVTDSLSYVDIGYVKHIVEKSLIDHFDSTALTERIK